MNGRVFVNNATLGLYAKIVQSPEYRDAKVQTSLEMLPELIGPDAEPLDLRFTGPDGEEVPTGGRDPRVERTRTSCNGRRAAGRGNASTTGCSASRP